MVLEDTPAFCWGPGGTVDKVFTDPGTAVVWGPGGVGSEVQCFILYFLAENTWLVISLTK